MRNACSANAPRPVSRGGNVQGSPTRSARSIRRRRVHEFWAAATFASDDAFPEPPPFDAAIGRYVLHHQPDPVATIRRVAAAVRQGGIIAFHEPAGHISGLTLPVVDLYVKLERCLSSVFDAMLPHRDIGGRLIACFEEARLPTPHLIWESIAGGHDSPLWRLLAMTYQSLLPQIALASAAADG